MSFFPSRNTTSIFLSTQSTNDPEVVNAMLETISCASILSDTICCSLALVEVCGRVRRSSACSFDGEFEVVATYGPRLPMPVCVVDP